MTIERLSSEELWLIIITFTLSSANLLNTSDMISAKSKPAPLTFTMATLSMRLRALTIPVFELQLSVMTVPGVSGLNVFFILTGIFFLISGSKALGCRILAPKWASSMAS